MHFCRKFAAVAIYAFFPKKIGHLKVLTNIMSAKQPEQGSPRPLTNRGKKSLTKKNQSFLLNKGRCTNLIIEGKCYADAISVLCQVQHIREINFIFSRNYRNSIQDIDNRYYRWSNFLTRKSWREIINVTEFLSKFWKLNQMLKRLIGVTGSRYAIFQIQYQTLILVLSSLAQHYTLFLCCQHRNPNINDRDHLVGQLTIPSHNHTSYMGLHITTNYLLMLAQ